MGATNKDLGLLFMALGGLAALVGLAVYLDWLSWFGSLPGDIRIERENTRIYIPITSMLVVSAMLTLCVWIVRRWL